MASGMSADDDGRDPVSCLRAFARPGKSITERSERRDLAKVTEVGKDFLLQEASRAVATNANGAVVMKVYGSDGTPMLTDRMWLRKLGSRVLRRRGKCGQEWLVDRTFYRVTDIQGNKRVSVVLRDPVALTSKTAWALAAACFAHSPSVRSLGHFGAAVTVYNFDRGYLSPMERLVRRKHMMESEESTRENKDIEGLLDFVICLGDPMHDAMNGYEWGLKPFVVGEAMKDIYVSVCAVRNAYDALMLHIEGWIVGVLSFGEPWATEEICMTLWGVLGLEQDICDILVQYRVLWYDGQLRIDMRYKDEDLLVDRLVFALVGAWRFIRFSESRWLSLGPTSRALVAAELTGISSLIHFARKQPGTSEYYIHGWDRRGKAGNSLCIIAAISAGPAESFLESLLDDDRVVLAGESLVDGLQAAMFRLKSLPMEMFEVMSPLCDKSASELYSAVVQAASTSVSFITFRCLRLLQEAPFVHCYGDVEQNMINLAAGAEPQEPCARQAWRLMRCGYPVKCLVEVWENIKQVPWSTVGIEQLHAGAAQMHKHHPHLGSDVLSARSFCWGMRALVNAPEASARLGKMENELRRLHQSIPNLGHITGRQVFLKEAICEARHLLAGGLALKQGVLSQIMSQHAAEYRRLDPAQRAAYHKKASQIVSQRRSGIRENIEDLRNRLALDRKRGLEELEVANPWRLSSCRLSDAQLASFRRMYRAGGYSNAVVDRMRLQAAVAPPVPSMEFRLRLMSFSVPSVDRQAPLEWVRRVCLHREEFIGKVILVNIGEGGGDQEAFLVSWAFKNPIVLALTRLRRRPIDLSFERGAMVSLNEHWPFDFDVLDDYLYSDGGGMRWSFDQLMVLSGVALLVGGRVASVAQPMAFEDIVDDLPAPARAETAQGDAKRQATCSASAQAKFVQSNPWALEFLDGGRAILQKERKRLGERADEGGDSDCTEEVDALGEVSALFEAMAEAKDAVGDEDLLLFRTRPLMGKWTLRHTGVVCDAYQCRAVGEDAELFCLRFNISQPLRFSTMLYGKEGALTCCRYWCAKVSYFYQVYMDAGATGFPFGDDTVNAWREPEAFSALVRALPVQAAQARFESLRSLRPLAPP